MIFTQERFDAIHDLFHIMMPRMLREIAKDAMLSQWIRDAAFTISEGMCCQD